MEKNLRYARRTGLKEIAAWGVEWWYYLKIHGEPGLWQTWKQLTQD
jgi:hypothetical protein